MKLLVSTIATLMLLAGFANAEPRAIYQIEVPYISKAQIQRVKADFAKENKLYDSPSAHFVVNEATGYLQVASTGTPLKNDPNEDKQKVAEEFLLKNRKFFGFSEAEVKALEYIVTKAPIGNVYAKSKTPIAYPGAPLNNFQYSIQVTLTVGNGEVVNFNNRTTREFSGMQYGNLNPSPRINADDATIMNQLVGREMKYHGFAGNELSAGKINKSDLSAPTLMIYTVHDSKGKKLTAYMAWKYTVTLKSLRWDFYFKVEDGSLIQVNQMFATFA